MKTFSLFALLLVTSNAVTLRKSAEDPNLYLPPHETITRGAGEHKGFRWDDPSFVQLSGVDPAKVYSPLLSSPIESKGDKDDGRHKLNPSP